MSTFGRLVTAMVTPFNDQLQVDMERFEALVEHLIAEQQNDALVVCGTTGESPTLTDEEKVALFQAAVRVSAGRARIIAGTGSYNTAHSIELTHAAEQAGVDGLLLVAPYYSRPSQEGLYQHFKAIAESTKLPIMLYNIPSRTGIQLELATTVRLTQELPNIVASKEAHGDLDHVSRLVARTPEHFQVYSGDDAWTLPFLSVGAYGVVSVAGHLIGREIKQLISSFVDGRHPDALRLHQQLYPVFKGLFECPHRVPNPAPVKHALNARGIQVGSLRLPMVPVTAAEAAYIESVLPQ